MDPKAVKGYRTSKDWITYSSCLEAYGQSYTISDEITSHLDKYMGMKRRELSYFPVPAPPCS